MSHRFAELAFTDRVKAIQEQEGSRASYARFEGGEAHHDRLGAAEAAFLEARDSFYLATVSETGWPYVQHRGGPPGFLKVLDEATIGFADFRGNRQYVSLGNLGGADRVSLILVDYPHRRRLKILGHARPVDDAATLARLTVPGYPAKVERGLLIAVAAFDWNCPQHLTPRFTETEIAAAEAPLHARIAELEAALAAR
jgi:predicted pyridoxine 5'-phosphate oxidase superfamily flavin-nucleotide-binding protein